MTARRRKDPFPRIPTKFLPAGFDAGDWGRVGATFDELDARPVSTLAQMERWVRDWSELSAALNQERAQRYVAMTCHTDDAAAEKRYLAFQQEIVPRAKPRWYALEKRYLSLPSRRKLPRRRYLVFDRSVENDVRLFREENVALELRETQLAQRYQKIMGTMSVSFDGQERTLQQMARHLEEQDPARRKGAWELIARRYLQDRDAMDSLFDDLAAVRGSIARNSGFANFRDYAFPMKGRFDYGPRECERYHDAAEQIVVPALRELHERRRKRLKLAALRPWDLHVDPAGRAPLRPFENSADLFNGVREIYRRISPDLAETFSAIGDRKLLDLDSRKGKAPGGYQYTMDVDRVPFIFMNAAGLNRDVKTLLHEGGHAFHSVFARNDPLVAYRRSPSEFAEVASQGMEIIGLDHLDVFYAGVDAARARHEHFDHCITLLAWVAQIDAFQHRVYTDPGHSREARRATWLELRGRFMAGVDWSGLDEAHASLWHRQQHLFTSPFYYIEYAISLLGALQLWQNARNDRAKAIRRYRAALSLGGSRPLPELFEAAGLVFDFSGKTVRPLVAAVMKELTRGA